VAKRFVKAKQGKEADSSATLASTGSGPDREKAEKDYEAYLDFFRKGGWWSIRLAPPKSA
jgi:hypothetical protein